MDPQLHRAGVRELDCPFRFGPGARDVSAGLVPADERQRQPVSDGAGGADIDGDE
jgi:hypothetical protein